MMVNPIHHNDFKDDGDYTFGIQSFLDLLPTSLRNELFSIGIVESFEKGDSLFKEYETSKKFFSF